MNNNPFNDKINKAVADVARKVMEESSHRDFKIGQQVHLGMGTKGGAGYKGTLQKIEGDTAHVQLSDEGKYGPRVVKGHVSKLSMTEAKEKEQEDRPDVPFAGPYRDATKPAKDKFGNVIKNRAKSLAKQGMAGVRKEEVAEGFDKLTPQQKAHQYNLDSAQREIDRRHGEGEDMTGATIHKKTYEIVKPKKQGVAEGNQENKAKKNAYVSSIIQKKLHQSVLPSLKYGRRELKKEEAEQMDEVLDTVEKRNKYLDASIVSAEKHASKARTFRDAPSTAGDEAARKLAARNAGVERVTKKIMTREEAEQIDEISDRAKHRYMGSAVADLTSRSMEHGFMSGLPRGVERRDDAKERGRKIKNRQMGIARVADTLVKKEEAEQIDESWEVTPNPQKGKKLGLKNYHEVSHKGKVVGDIHKDRMGWATHHHKSGMSFAEDETKEDALQTIKDTHNITAASKLAREEVEQMDELSNTTVNNYRRTATELEKTGKRKPKNYGTFNALNKVSNSPQARVLATSGGTNRPSLFKGKNTQKEEVEQVQEVSKQTLGSYIKKASHDVATKGALVRHFATKSRDERSKDNYVQSRKDDDTANKLFDKSWKRRQGMAKAVDRLTKEEVEQIDEVNAKQIKKDLDSGMSHDAVIGKHANRRTSNTDEIRKIIKQHAWDQRMKKEEAEQVAEGFVIHKGKHEPGTKSSLEGAHHGVTVKPVYTDKKEAQAHANKINAGRGYKPGDEKSSLYGGVLYQVSPAKSMKEEVEQIDELSKKTLISYLGKANKSSETNKNVAIKLLQKGGDPNNMVKASKKLNKAVKRRFGVDSAVDKLAGGAKVMAKEEAQQVAERLTGKQHKIDANKNGKVDAHDFKLLRSKTKKMMKESVQTLMEDTTPALSTSMKAILADAFHMYFKAHSYHWNVEGANFPQYHKFFGEIYEQLFDTIDPIAEEIRALGDYAPRSLDELKGSTSISTESAETPAAMLSSLLGDNNKIIAGLTNGYQIAEASGEIGLSNFLQDKIDAHKKLGWMIKSTSKGA